MLLPPDVPPFPRERLLEMARRLYFAEQDARVLLEAVAAYDDAARQVTISQHAATVTQLAHEWAEARRAHLTRERLPPVTVKGPPLGYELEPPDEWDAPHPDTTRSANRLSGLARRLERACLGPRPKKEDPTC